MYTIVIPRTIQKAIIKLGAINGRRVLAAIRSLADDPRPHECKKLANREAWRIRVGDYRVIYEIDDQTLTVLIVEAGHRREAYR